MQGGVFDNDKARPLPGQLRLERRLGLRGHGLDGRLNDQQALWNVAAQISTVDAQNPQGCSTSLAHPSRGNPRWNHQPGAWFRAMLALVVLTVAALVVAIVVLRRFDPI